MNKVIASTLVAAGIAAGGLAVATTGPVAAVGAGPAPTADAPTRVGHPHHRVLRAAVATSADAIGISPKELVTQFRAGQSVAEIAVDNDVEVQVVKDALTAKGTAAIATALTDGKIDAERAAKLTERLPQAIDRFLNFHRGDRRDA